MTSTEPKNLARRLRAELAQRGLDIAHSESLEVLAHVHGYRDWNTMAAAGSTAADTTASGEAATAAAPAQVVTSSSVAIPILRMFDVERTLAFYVDFLGFNRGFEHRFSPEAPLYTEVERDGVRLHLSEHHGDATPGSAVIIEIADAAALQRELIARDYPYARPGLEQQDWGLTVTVGDPASNRLIFLQR